LQDKVVFFAEPPQSGDGSRAPVRGCPYARQGLAAVMVAVLLSLFGADGAEAVPSVTYRCSPAPQNCVGWYTSNVSIDWTITPSDATVVAGCRDKSFTTDTAGTNEFCKVDDGEATVTVELKMRVDKTAPTVLRGDPDRGADVGGWYNRPVTVAFQGSDQTSGIDACTTLTYSGPDSGQGSLTGTCFDQAGNVGTLGYGLKYDDSAPSLSSPAPDRAASPAGWFNGPVAFAFRGTDPVSGIEACSNVTYSGPQTAAGSVSGSCRDRAGNSTSGSFPVRYDTSPPATTAGRPSRGPDRNGWYNRQVQVDFTGSDQLSGIQSCTVTTYAGPDTGTASVPGACTDRAGNTGNTVLVPLRYDDTAPLISSAAPARSPDSGDWYNHPVEVQFGGSDAMSGLESCTRASYSAPDSANASLSGTCMDRAGNPSGSLVHRFSYDATPPEVLGASTDRAPDSDGWYTRPVTFSFEGRDATSGIDACPAVTYTGPDGAAAAATGVCHDRAGNKSSRPFGLRFDATAPAIADLAATPADRSVALSWRTSADAETVRVTRTPGVGMEKSTFVFGGPGTSFVDGRVDNGVKYAYEVRVQDPAGNAGSETVSATPFAPLVPLALGGGPPAAAGSVTATTGVPLAPLAQSRTARLLAPAAGAVIRAGRRPLLRWTPVPGASYYNVQLFRDGRKILTAWTSRPLFRLERRWRHDGKRIRLTPGDYRWIVWPGFGARAKADYGRRIGRRAFEIGAAGR
jgi:hypothetical protein